MAEFERTFRDAVRDSVGRPHGGRGLAEPVPTAFDRESLRGMSPVRSTPIGREIQNTSERMI